MSCCGVAMPFFAFFWKDEARTPRQQTLPYKRPIRIAVEILDQFQYRTTAKSSQRFRRHRFVALLHRIQGKADTVLHLGGEAPRVFQTRADKNAGLLRRSLDLHE